MPSSPLNKECSPDVNINLSPYGSIYDKLSKQKDAKQSIKSHENVPNPFSMCMYDIYFEMLFFSSNFTTFGCYRNWTTSSKTKISFLSR